MNYFFFLDLQDHYCELTIPKFRNDGITKNENLLYSANIKDNAWCFSKNPQLSEDAFFWYVHKTEENKNSIFFISTEDSFLAQENSLYLNNLGNFTETDPAFRCNLEIGNNFGAWSSYQSEYPFRMVKLRGNIYSALGNLSIKYSEFNGVFIRNIFHKPIQEEFPVYILDQTNWKIVLKTSAITNMTTFIDLKNIDAKDENLVLWGSGYLGVPIYFSSNSNQGISLEHTHPPHESLHGKERFELVSKLKIR